MECLKLISKRVVVLKMEFELTLVGKNNLFAKKHDFSAFYEPRFYSRHATFNPRHTTYTFVFVIMSCLLIMLYRLLRFN
jgi:hypothetical protein